MIPRRWLLSALWLGLLGSRACGGEEVLNLPQGENLVITVPDTLKYRVVQENNTVFAEVTDAGRSVILQLRFMTDSGQQLDSTEKLQAIIGDFSREDIEQSVEQKLVFKNLSSVPSAGQYVIVTDGNLIGHVPPAGQYLKLTRGIKVGADFAVVFSILSQDESSRTYQAVLKIARDGVAKK